MKLTYLVAWYDNGVRFCTGFETGWLAMRAANRVIVAGGQNVSIEKSMR